MLLGAVATLIIAAPTLAIEEDWHGRPMVDQPGHLWVIPTLVVAAAFTLGGVLGTRGLIDLWRALWYGLLVGAISAGLLFLADLVRRAMHAQAPSAGLWRFWFEAAALSVVLSSLGGAFSYLRATRKH
jgi:hypothetical protein